MKDQDKTVLALSFGRKNVADLKAKIGLLTREEKGIQIKTIHALGYAHMKTIPTRNLTPALFEKGHEFGFHFGARRLKAVAGQRYDELAFQGFEPETEHDLVYNELMRLRARMLQPKDTVLSGYLADEVERLWTHMNEGFRRGLWDFTYLLEHWIETGYKPRADFVGIDEIQDCTRLQIEAIKLIEGDDIWYLGDPDQSIYGWAGCDVTDINHLSVDRQEERPVSYRVPSNIAAFADQVLDRASFRAPGKIKSVHDGGTVETIPSFHEVCARLSADKKSYGETFILARTNHILGQARKIAEAYGLNMATDEEEEIRERLIALIERPTPTLSYRDAQLLTHPLIPAKQFFRYGTKKRLRTLTEAATSGQKDGYMTWDVFFQDYATEQLREVFERHDADFLLEEGEQKQAPRFDSTLPRVLHHTMHASKGLEADTVVVLANTTERVLKHENHDEEVRLAYVAATRAKNRLIISSLDGLPMRQMLL
jgi:superfamily I DNA/RNA helicase